MWDYIDPFAMLSLLTRHSDGLKDALAEALKRNPVTPDQGWHIVWYADEATPGNLLRVDNARKCQSMYWSFLELGPELLSRAEVHACQCSRCSICLDVL